MATKKKKKSESTLDNLQFKPIIIAAIAGLFLGMQAAGTGALVMFVFGALTGIAISAAVYLTFGERKRKEESE